MWVEPVELFKHLVRTDTTNPPGNESRLLLYLRDILEKEGISCIYQETDTGRGNLLAWLPGNTEKQKTPLILLSHVDVVSANPKEWIHPPFEAVEENGYIYGRGAVDTKHLTVMEIMALIRLKESGADRNRTVYFLATSDEESGSKYGLRWFLEHDIAIHGETISGKEIFKDSDVINEGGGFPVLTEKKEFYLCETGQKSCGVVEFKVKSERRNFFRNNDNMIRAMRLIRDIGAGLPCDIIPPTVEEFERKITDAGSQPCLQGMLHTMKRNTLTVTMVTGNESEIMITCDVRLLPGFGREDLENICQCIAGKWGAGYYIRSLTHGYENQQRGELLSVLEKATLRVSGRTAEEAEIIPFLSSGSNDGHYLTDTGARIYGYSPVLPWDMTFDQAVTFVHGIEERIHRESLLFGCRVLELAVSHFVTGGNIHD